MERRIPERRQMPDKAMSTSGYRLVFEIPGGARIYSTTDNFPFTDREIDMLRRLGAVEPNGPKYLVERRTK